MNPWSSRPTTHTRHQYHNQINSSLPHTEFRSSHLNLPSQRHTAQQFRRWIWSIHLCIILHITLLTSTKGFPCCTKKSAMIRSSNPVLGLVFKAKSISCYITWIFAMYGRLENIYTEERHNTKAYNSPFNLRWLNQAGYMGWTCGTRVGKVKVNTTPLSGSLVLGNTEDDRRKLLTFNSEEGCKVLTGFKYQLSEG
jgi:hypothetical protein